MINNLKMFKLLFQFQYEFLLNFHDKFLKKYEGIQVLRYFFQCITLFSSL